MTRHPVTGMPKRSAERRSRDRLGKAQADAPRAGWPMCTAWLGCTGLAWSCSWRLVLPDRQIRVIAQQFPGWETWQSFDGRPHARVVGAIPPIIVHGDSSGDLVDRLRKRAS
jgi:hypothetical protein